VTHSGTLERSADLARLPRGNRTCRSMIWPSRSRFDRGRFAPTGCSRLHHRRNPVAAHSLGTSACCRVDGERPRAPSSINTAHRSLDGVHEPDQRFAASPGKATHAVLQNGSADKCQREKLPGIFTDDGAIWSIHWGRHAVDNELMRREATAERPESLPRPRAAP